LMSGGRLAQKESGDICGLEAKANESARPCGPVAAYCAGPGVCRFGGGVDGSKITAGWKKGAAAELKENSFAGAERSSVD